MLCTRLVMNVRTTLFPFPAGTITNLTDGSFYDPYSPIIFTLFFFVGLCLLSFFDLAAASAQTGWWFW